MTELPLVTVTVCARNGEHWVEDCLNAIHAQTHRPLEIIAVNDGSMDSTGTSMDKWKQSNDESDVAITVIHQEALGLSAGRMAALEALRDQRLHSDAEEVRSVTSEASRTITTAKPTAKAAAGTRPISSYLTHSPRRP